MLLVSALRGQRLPDIILVTEPVPLTLSSNHMEVISFFIFKAPLTPLVLAYPWLKQHNPSIDLKKECESRWREECHMNCFKSATPLVNFQNRNKTAWSVLYSCRLS